MAYMARQFLKGNNMRLPGNSPVKVNIMPPNLNFWAISFLLDLKTKSKTEISINDIPVMISPKGISDFLSIRLFLLYQSCKNILNKRWISSKMVACHAFW